LAVDNAGDLLVADDGSIPPQGPHIYKVLSSGALAVAVGNGQKPFSGDGGAATDAKLSSPQGVAVDAVGNVYIADYANDRIRKVSASGIITTLAGDGIYGSSGDGGPAVDAQVAPFNVAVDGTGNLFLFDIPNRTIRKISASGMISTVAIIGGNNYFVAADGSDNVYAACPAHTLDTVYETSLDGTMRTVAGNGTFGFSGDGGPATSAALAYPNGIALDGAGNLYIADGQNHRIRKVMPDGIIMTIAGSSATTSNQGCCSPSRGGFSGDGGPAIDAQLSFPGAVAVDGIGNVFIADSGNHRVRKVSPDGIITTIAGDGTQGYSGDGGSATGASFAEVGAVAVDSAGNVYVADYGNNAIRILRPVRHREIHRN
jgi:sugar lactone lactonase YvrE